MTDNRSRRSNRTRLTPDRLRELAERLAAGAYDHDAVRRAIVQRILAAHDLPA